MFFDKKNSADEIAKQMQSILVSEKIEKYASVVEDKMIKVAEHLNEVAEELDNLGLAQEAEVITKVLEVVAKKKSKKRKVKKNKKSDKLTSDKMVENLKDHGTPFNLANDENCLDCGDIAMADDKVRPCNCENSHCPHGLHSCKNKQGKRKAMYVGRLCDECADRMPEEYMLNTDENEAKDNSEFNEAMKLLEDDKILDDFEDEE